LNVATKFLKLVIHSASDNFVAVYNLHINVDGKWISP